MLLCGKEALADKALAWDAPGDPVEGLENVSGFQRLVIRCSVDYAVVVISQRLRTFTRPIHSCWRSSL